MSVTLMRRAPQEKLLMKFGNPMDDAREFEVKWMMTYFCQKDFPELPFAKIYANRLVIPQIKEVFSKLHKVGLLGEIKSYGGCWLPRYIRGYEAQKILSIHTWGLAIDFNTTDNPLGVTKDDAIKKGLNPFSDEFNNVWRESGWVCGIDFKRADGMHFEFTNV